MKIPAARYPEIRNPIVVHPSKKAIALLSPFFRFFAWLIFRLPVHKRALIPEFTSRFCLVELTFGMIAIITSLSRKLTSDVISAGLSS